MTTGIVLKPLHPAWNEFMERLNGPDGCNFRRDEGGRIRWDCEPDGPTRFKSARKLLAEIPGIDIESTLTIFEAHGGHCDCEILFNVADGWQTEAKA